MRYRQVRHSFQITLFSIILEVARTPTRRNPEYGKGTSTYLNRGSTIRDLKGAIPQDLRSLRLLWVVNSLSHKSGQADPSILD